MSYARQYMTTRATLAALLMGGLLLFGLWMQEEAAEARVETVQGRILVSDPQAPDTQALPTLLVELEDGRQVRLLLTGRRPQVGERVQLQRITSGQGTESYQLLDSQ